MWPTYYWANTCTFNKKVMYSHWPENKMYNVNIILYERVSSLVVICVQSCCLRTFILNYYLDKDTCYEGSNISFTLTVKKLLRVKLCLTRHVVCSRLLVVIIKINRLQTNSTVNADFESVLSIL